MSRDRRRALCVSDLLLLSAVAAAAALGVRVLSGRYVARPAPVHYELLPAPAWVWVLAFGAVLIALVAVDAALRRIAESWTHHRAHSDQTRACSPTRAARPAGRAPAAAAREPAGNRPCVPAGRPAVVARRRGGSVVRLGNGRPPGSSRLDPAMEASALGGVRVTRRRRPRGRRGQLARTPVPLGGGRRRGAVLALRRELLPGPRVRHLREGAVWRVHPRMADRGTQVSALAAGVAAGSAGAGLDAWRWVRGDYVSWQPGAKSSNSFVKGQNGGVYQLQMPGLAFVLSPGYYIDRHYLSLEPDHDDELPRVLLCTGLILLSIYVLLGLATFRFLARYSGDAASAWALSLLLLV